MSFIAEAENFTISIKNALDRDVSGVASNLASVTSTFASQLTDKLETIYTGLKTNADELKGQVDKDFDDFTTFVGGLKTTVAGIVENALQGAVNEVGKLTDGLKKAGTTLTATVDNGTTYMRHKMRNDLEAAIHDAKAKFDSIEGDFKTAISGHANDFITFVKSEIDGFVSGAQGDLSNVDTLRQDLVTKLTGTIDGIKGDLEGAKTKLRTNLDKVITFAKTEFAKIEARAKQAKAYVDDIAIRIAGVSLFLASLYLVFEIFRKNLAAEERRELEEHAQKMASIQPTNATNPSQHQPTSTNSGHQPQPTSVNSGF